MRADIAALERLPLLQAGGDIDTPKLTLVQRRMLIYIYAMARDQLAHSDPKNIRNSYIDLKSEDLIYTLNKSGGGNDSIQIWDQLITLNRTQVVLRYSDDRGERERITTLIKSIDRPITGKGIFTVELDPKIVENIIYLDYKPDQPDQLKSTKQEKDKIYRYISLRYALSISSENSLRLYEILKSVEGMREWKISYVEIKNMLHITEKYKQYTHFRDYILEKAKENFSSTDISFTYKEVRGKRRVVTDLIFTVRKRKKEIQGAVYTVELTQLLQDKGIKNLKHYKEKGVREDHWREALNHELETPQMTVRKALDLWELQMRDQPKQITDAEQKQKDDDLSRIEKHKEYFRNNKDDYPQVSWNENDAYVVSPSGGINFIWTDFLEKLGKWQKEGRTPTAHPPK
jgi:hypothetical protein